MRHSFWLRKFEILCGALCSMFEKRQRDRYRENEWNSQKKPKKKCKRQQMRTFSSNSTVTVPTTTTQIIITNDKILADPDLTKRPQAIQFKMKMKTKRKKRNDGSVAKIHHRQGTIHFRFYSWGGSIVNLQSVLCISSCHCSDPK